MYLRLALRGAARPALRPMPFRDALQKVLGSFDEGSLVGAIGAAVKLKVSTQIALNVCVSEFCSCTLAWTTTAFVLVDTSHDQAAVQMHCSCLPPTLALGAQGFQQVPPAAEKQHANKAVEGSKAALAEAPSEFGAELEVCFPSARSSNEAVLALCDGVALHGTASATTSAERFVAPLPVCLASA